MMASWLVYTIKKNSAKIGVHGRRQYNDFLLLASKNPQDDPLENLL